VREGEPEGEWEVEGGEVSYSYILTSFDPYSLN
jgi:hypothetical protein